MGDWVVDKVEDGFKSASGAWKNVTSFFGGGKHAHA